MEGLNVVEDWCADLNKINFNIAKLLKHKQELETKLLTYHKKIVLDENGALKDIVKEGQTSHEAGKYKITMKTEYNYSVNIEEYEIYKSQLGMEINPVKESVKYELNKRQYKETLKYASDEDLDTLGKFITFKVAKPSVKVAANI